MKRESTMIGSSGDPIALRKELIAFIAGKRIGRIGIDEHGSTCFIYDEGYEGVPLSVSMPVHRGEGRARPCMYEERVVRPYLFGLLPDDREQRVSLAEQCGVSPDDALGLLHCKGLDLPGAVQFCSPDSLDTLAARAEDFVPISEMEIAEDLRRIGASSHSSWQTPQERWSLAGNQSKLAYAYLENRWWRCEGAAATTHIVKPGIPELKHEALNETICLRLARACGVSAVEASYRCFGNKPAIIVERYDRSVSGMHVARQHQEDICQALSIMPMKKYASDGGPSAADVLHLLERLPNARENKITFTSELFFNLLVLAPDAHGKNYSLLLLEDGVRMAPLYDCASGAAYDRQDKKPWSLAMGIGGKTRMDDIGVSEIKRYARVAGLEEELCMNLMGNLALRVLQNLTPTFAAVRAEVSSQAAAVDELESRMKDPIFRQAERLSNIVREALDG